MHTLQLTNSDMSLVMGLFQEDRVLFCLHLWCPSMPASDAQILVMVVMVGGGGVRDGEEMEEGEVGGME